MSNPTVSTPARETIHGATGTVARLVDRLLQQNPQAQVRFAVGGCSPSSTQWVLLSVYSDDKGTVWVDIEAEPPK